MRRRAVQLIWGFLCALCLAGTVFAQVPHLVRYQGMAEDSQGVPLEGPYNLTFRLYTAVTSGTMVWEEAQQAVQVEHGNFTVLLGSVTPLNVDWSQSLWLSVQINTDPELSPRQQITSVPLALRAETAEQLATPVTTSNITDDANKLVPAGAVVLWTGAACPAGYTRLTSLDGKFLVSGNQFAPAAGGSSTHNHGAATGSHALTIAEMPPHTHGLTGRPSDDGNGIYSLDSVMDSPLNPPVPNQTESAGSGQGHSHTIAPADSRPEFATVLLCQKS